MTATSKQAELLHGYVKRKSGKELIIKLRAGHTCRTKLADKWKHFKVGQKVRIGWDYERVCIRDIWTEDEVIRPNEDDIPQALLSMADETTYNEWVDEVAFNNWVDEPAQD